MNKSGWIEETFRILGIVLVSVTLLVMLIKIHWWLDVETELSVFEQSYYISATKINNKAVIQLGRDREYAQFSQNREKLTTMITSLVNLDNQVIDNILSQAGVIQVDNTGKQIFPRVLINQTTEGE